MLFRKKVKRYEYDNQDISFYEEWYDNPEVYFDGTQEVVEVLKHQFWVNPKLVDYGDKEEPEYPWHETSEEQYDELNGLLIECEPEARRCTSIKAANKFIKKHPLVYRQYFEIPITVFETENSSYVLGRDGRHRLAAAKKRGNLLPVWVIEWCEPRNIDRDFYLKYHVPGHWQFRDGPIGYADGSEENE